MLTDRLRACYLSQRFPPIRQCGVLLCAGDASDSVSGAGGAGCVQLRHFWRLLPDRQPGRGCNLEVCRRAGRLHRHVPALWRARRAEARRRHGLLPQQVALPS